MKAAIYMRTSKQDKAHRAYNLQKQEEHNRELAMRRGLRVAYEHVFCDLDYAGDTPPDCWTQYDYDGITRPALSAMIQAIEDEDIRFVIVRRMDRLATSSEILMQLLHFFSQHHVRIVAMPEAGDAAHDSSETFAISILAPIIHYDSAEERERKAKLRARKVEEIERLKDKIIRLEAEIKELDI